MFNEEKTTALACYLLDETKIEYLKLIKMMYIADRKMLELHNKLITGDTFVNMRLGPVPINTYGLIREEKEITHFNKQIKQDRKNSSYCSIWSTWSDHIKVDEYAISVKEKPHYENILVETEMKVIDEIKEKYKNYSSADLVSLLHNKDFCPEWVDPEPNSISPLSITRIMRSLNKTQEEIDDYIVKYELGIDF